MTGQRISVLMAASAVAGILQLAPSVMHAQDDALDCVMEPKSTIELGSAEQGILAEVLVARGDRVQKDALVARLDTEMERLTAELARLRATADADVRSGRVQVDFRRKEVVRLETLKSKKHVPEKDYAQAVVERRLAEFSLQASETEQRIAQVEYERAKERLKRRSLHSPVDGVIVDVIMFPGEYVHEQAVVMTIAETDPLNVEVFVPVARYGTISTGMPAEVRPEAPVGGTYRAKVAVVDGVLDAASRTFGVRLELPNPDYALPGGLRCTVRFLPSTEAQADADLGLSLTK